jgi:acetyltransferase
MLTDALSNGGLEVPSIEGPEAEKLLEQLYPGSSVSNPIDFLATGTAEQLGIIIDFVDQKFDKIDAMIVIFGTPGLFDISDVYEILDQKMKSVKKPLYPVLPSILTAEREVKEFLSKGRINFSDEVLLGNALVKVYLTPKPSPENIELPDIDTTEIRKVIDSADNGYLSPEQIGKLLDASGVSRSNEKVVSSESEAIKFANEVGFPLVMKVVGPVHKSDVGGVVLNINNLETVKAEYQRLMQIKDTTAVLMYPMLFGTEVFIGAKRDDKFGHLVMCGLGGIFIEVLKDVNTGLAPISKKEAIQMIRQLKGYGIIKGARKQDPVNEDLFVDAVMRIATLVITAPEIFEMDLNPLLGTSTSLTAVDARIRIEK